MSDCVKYIPKCCDTCTYLLHCADCADKECLSYSHYELDGCVAEEYRTAINQALADERRNFVIWLDTHGFMCKMDFNISRVDEALSEYGKEHNNAE